MAVPSTASTAAQVSLYVGDLHPDVDENYLAKAFSEFKSIAGVRICRDSASGRSLCYGYVNFITLDDALHAMQSKNHSILNGKEIRVTWVQRHSDARRSGIGNVFVKNLSESVDSAGLQDMFKVFGDIISCKVVTTEDGKSKGFGFVQFESEESANSAIEKLNGSLVGDKKIYVGKFIRQSDRLLPSPDAKYTNLYIKNLDPDITEECLQGKFSEFGKIASLVIAKDENGNSKGFAFVSYDNPDNARKAAEAMNGSLLGTKALYVARAQKKAEREQILRWQYEERRKEQILRYKESNVYVKNIDDSVTDEELRNLFSQCGTITSAKLMRDNKGLSRGFGFVCFSSPEEANRAVTTFYGYMFHGKPLYVAIAQRKEEREARLLAQREQFMARLVGSPAAAIPGGYSPLYYPSGVVPQVSPQPGLMYQPLGLRPGWRPNGFASSPRLAFQLSPHPILPNTQRLNRQNRGRTNGRIGTQGSVQYMPNLHRPTPPNGSNNHQRAGQVKHSSHGHVQDGNKGSCLSATALDAGKGLQVAEISSMLAAALPEQQKEILGEQLYPLIHERQPDLAAKITGMLLEMDKSELLLLIESPESLAARVNEAVEVLKLSKSNVASQDSGHPS